MRGSGLKILIVEDSALILERMNSILRELDCISEIVDSGNGNDAISVMNATNPDVVLLDINLPGKSGISILKEIKSQSTAKVVMLTNYSDQFYRNLCSELGADHFLDKSTEFEKIPSLLNEIYISKS
jgi:two-component system chemotaxis response regulator CheY